MDEPLMHYKRKKRQQTTKHDRKINGDRSLKVSCLRYNPNKTKPPKERSAVGRLPPTAGKIRKYEHHQEWGVWLNN